MKGKYFLQAFKIKKEIQELKQQYQQKYYFVEFSKFKQINIPYPKSFISTDYYHIISEEKFKENILFSGRQNEINNFIEKIKFFFEKNYSLIW